MIIIDIELCDGCGECIDACPRDCMGLGDEDNYDEVAYVMAGCCTECEVCVIVCPNGAIRLGEVTYDNH